jgi:hypothetical protein
MNICCLLNIYLLLLLFLHRNHLNNQMGNIEREKKTTTKTAKEKKRGSTEI